MKCCCYGLQGACLTATAIFNDSVKRKDYSSESTGRFCVTVTKLWTLHTPWLNTLFLCFNTAWHCKSHGWKTRYLKVTEHLMALVYTIQHQELSAKHYQPPSLDMPHLTGWEPLTQTSSDGKSPGRQAWSDATNSAWSMWSKEQALSNFPDSACTQIQDFCSTFLFWMKIK